VREGVDVLLSLCVLITLGMCVYVSATSMAFTGCVVRDDGVRMHGMVPAAPFCLEIIAIRVLLQNNYYSKFIQLSI
jgi:hypothetical protein